MSDKERCDEMIRLIDEVLAEVDAAPALPVAAPRPMIGGRP